MGPQPAGCGIPSLKWEKGSKRPWLQWGRSLQAAEFFDGALTLTGPLSFNGAAACRLRNF